MTASPARAFLAREVVQTSAMDCGPASLKSLLEGFGIGVSYGRLREACQTDVDGTSIDTMEEVAVELGLAAEQIMLPVDTLLEAESEALPALVVVRNPDGQTHFVVVWRRHGPLLQIMDPAVGRRWVSCERFLDEVYVHEMAVPADGWREWATSPSATRVSAARLAALGLSTQEVGALLGAAAADPTWRSAARLDAAVRMVRAVLEAGGVGRGSEAGKLLARILADESTIPERYWSAFAEPAADEGAEQLRIRGAVLVRVAGRAAPAGAPVDGAPPAPLSPELVAALAEEPTHPARELVRLLAADGVLRPAALLSGVVLAAGGLLAQALLFRAMLDATRDLGTLEQRIAAVVALLVFLVALLLLELPIVAATLRLGRQLEARMRVAFLEKIPKLGDRYFQSRLTSDMVERSHSIQTVRLLPAVGAELVEAALQLGLTTAAMIAIAPRSAAPALVAALSGIALPLLAQPLLTERDLRVRTHAGALGRFLLDALMGLTAVRAHGAERPLRREHEGLLAEWSRAGLRLQRAAVGAEGLQAVVGVACTAWLLFAHLARAGAGADVLLLAYWALSLPALGQRIALGARQYPALRNITLRLLEPLGAPEEEAATIAAAPATPPQGAAPSVSSPAPATSTAGVAIEISGVGVRLAGHAVLDDLTLSIAAGEHVAVVGPSGAGKSSLVGLLLGWHRPTGGRLRVDGHELSGAHVERLRRHTAWVDPSVWLWNARLLDNLVYGAPNDPDLPIGAAIETSELRGVLERLPDGLQERLGEGGGLVSGGEGQRVRLARGLVRPDTRLVLLDEPFRGLDRAQRRRLLARVREAWRGATLLCVTHDLAETEVFDRVLVVDRGRLIEDGAPSALLADEASRYRRLFDAEREAHAGIWGDRTWRRLSLRDGDLVEGGEG